MPVIEGQHTGPGGPVRWRADYEVHERTIRLRAQFDGGLPPHEAQFDFDPARLDAAAAVEAFLQNHVARGAASP